MKQLLPQLDTLIRTHADILRESDQLKKLLEVRTLTYRVLEKTARSGAMPVTLQQANILCQQMNTAIQALSSGGHTGNGTPSVRRQVNREALRLAELLVKEEVRDFGEDYPSNNLDIKIECLPDRIIVVIGDDVAKLVVHPGYPAVPVDIESEARVVHATVTNCLRHFEGMIDNKDAAR